MLLNCNVLFYLLLYDYSYNRIVSYFYKATGYYKVFTSQKRDEIAQLCVTSPR